MPRTIPAELLAIMNADYDVVLRINTWSFGGGVPPQYTFTPVTFTLNDTEMEVSFYDTAANYAKYYFVQLERGAKINGIEYTVKSSKFYGTEWTIDYRGMVKVKASLFKPVRITYADGDNTYANVITAVCALADVTASFRNPTAACWSYQFLPTGKQVLLQKPDLFLNLLRQKYFIFGHDIGSQTIEFAQADPDALNPTDADVITWEGNGIYNYTRKSQNVYLTWRDENGTTHVSGSTDSPMHNLGFLPSTASPPTDPSAWFSGDTPDQRVNLEVESSYALSSDGTYVGAGKFFADVTESFDQKHSPSWWMDVREKKIVESTAGGAMPSTIERVANYTPLNTSYFDGVLSPSDNNVQAAFNTIDNNVYSKADVDSLIAGASFDFFLDNLASSIGGYYVMGAASGSAESTITAAALVTGTVIAAYATIVGEPTFDTLSAGLYDVHFHAQKTAGTNTLAIYAVLYERTGAGAETAILTFETSDAITAKTGVDLHGSIITDVILAAGSRLVLKIVAIVTGSGTAPTAAIYQEGTTDAHLSVRSTLTAFDGRYAPLTRTLTGTAPITVDGDNAAHDLNTNKVIAIIPATASVPGSMSAADKGKLDLLTLATAATISGGGTLALAGFTLTVPATGQAAVHTSPTVAGRIPYFSGTTGILTSESTLNYLTGGHIAIGNATALANVNVLGYGISTLDTGGIYGGNFTVYSNPAGASNAVVVGFSCLSGILGSQVHTGQLIGGQFVAWHRGSGALALAEGAQFGIQNTGGATITNAYGNIIATPTQNGAGSAMTNLYGLYIQAQTLGGTLNYALYTNAGLTRFGDQLKIDGAADRQQLVVTGFTTQAVGTALAQITRNDATAGISAMLGLTALGSGAAGDGGSILLGGKSSTTAAQAMGLEQWQWVVATHATRTARMTWSVYDTAAREGFRIEASGTAPMIGFLGAVAVVRPTALTAQLTTITATAPGTPDYAIQNLVQNTGFGFVTADEGQSTLKVILNLQTRVSELETKLQALGLLT